MKLFIVALLVAISYAQTECENGYEEVLEAGYYFLHSDTSPRPDYLGPTNEEDKCRTFCDEATDCFGFTIDTQNSMCFGFMTGVHDRDTLLASEEKIFFGQSRTMFKCFTKSWVNIGEGICMTKNGEYVDEEYPRYYNGNTGGPLEDCQRVCTDLGDGVCAGLSWKPSEQWGNVCTIYTTELLSKDPTGFSYRRETSLKSQSEFTYTINLAGTFCYAYKINEDRSPCQENELTYTYIPAAECPQEINEFFEDYKDGVITDQEMDDDDKVNDGLPATGAGPISPCTSEQIANLLKVGLENGFCEFDDGDNANNGALSASSPNCLVYEVFQWSCSASSETLISASSHGDPIIWTFNNECYDLSKDGFYLASGHPDWKHSVYVAVYNDFIREIQIRDVHEDDKILLSISNLNEVTGVWQYGFKHLMKQCKGFSWNECEFAFNQFHFDAQFFKFVVHIHFHDYDDPALKEGERGLHLDVYPLLYDAQKARFKPSEFDGVYFKNPYPEELGYCPANSARRN